MYFKTDACIVTNLLKIKFLWLVPYQLKLLLAIHLNDLFPKLRKR